MRSKAESAVWASSDETSYIGSSRCVSFFIPSTSSRYNRTISRASPCGNDTEMVSIPLFISSLRSKALCVFDDCREEVCHRHAGCTYHLRHK